MKEEVGGGSTFVASLRQLTTASLCAAYLPSFFAASYSVRIESTHSSSVLFLCSFLGIIDMTTCLYQGKGKLDSKEDAEVRRLYLASAEFQSNLEPYRAYKEVARR